MLPQINRLTKKKDFDMVFQAGKSSKSDFLIVKTLKNNLLSSRIGFVVSKKVSPKATVRNLIKRRLRVLLAHRIEQFSAPSDMVVIALPGIQKKTFEEMEKSVNRLFK